MSKIIFSVEDACDIPLDKLDEMGVKHISFGYRNETKNIDNPNLTIKEFYDEIRHGSTFKTSLINEFEFDEYFSKIVKEGDVIHLGFSGGLSGTNKCAKDAAEKINMQSTNKVYVIDTLTGSGAQSILLLECMKKAEEGASVHEICEFAEKLKMHLCLNFSPEDMKTLAKSGRLNKVLALIGTLLNIKPIAYCNNEGKFAMRQKVISRKKALLRMVELVKLNYNFESKHIFILHGDKEQDAIFIRDQLLQDERFKGCEFHIEMLGIIVGAHGGPGNICTCFTADKR